MTSPSTLTRAMQCLIPVVMGVSHKHRNRDRDGLPTKGGGIA